MTTDTEFTKVLFLDYSELADILTSGVLVQSHMYAGASAIKIIADRDTEDKSPLETLKAALKEMCSAYPEYKSFVHEMCEELMNETKGNY